MNEFLNDPAIIGEFIAEAREHLESLEPKLLKLEKNPEDPELLNAIFRSFHTIKGSSSFLSLVQITELSHKLENVLDKLRKKELGVTPEIIDLIFKGMDILKSLIEDVASGEEEKIKKITSYNLKEVEDFISKIDKAIQKPKIEEIREKGEITPKNEKDEEEKQIFLTAAHQHLSTIRECLEGLEKNPSNFDLIDALFRAVHSLKSSSHYMGVLEVKTLTEKQEEILQNLRKNKLSVSGGLLESLRLGYNFLFEFMENFQKGEKKAFNLEDVIEKMKKALEEDKTKTSRKTPPKKSPLKKEIVEKTIRVPEAKLDSLMNLVGELVINRSTFYSIIQKLENGAEVSQISREIKEAAQTMRRITTELQMTVTELHMLPIKTLFGKFPRLVRDLSREKGKKINLEVSGEETQLDKMMIEKMGDPLIHLVRNAIDHGIEMPEEREAKGKPTYGTIKLSASQEGETVIIQVEDDGRGINSELLRKMAVKKGIINEEKARILDKRECLELIFLPGFSTATKVTDLSGRGVGMDVVKDVVKKLKGEIQIDTEPDRGTKFTIKLPLTLAIVNVLLVEAAGQTFALPLSSIKETVKISKKKINKVLKKEITLLRENILGIVNLKELLNLTDHNYRREEDRVPVVVIQGRGKNLGLIVDALHRQEEIVIKPLEGIATNIPGLAGATVLGDGRVILILDPGELIQMATG
ncbi:hypothetical protein DRJ04_02115 [Candidatus Aerophobetes bacterium]|uniref:Chemotaxis protein CheA n=1 Tax=Aerophobetes bacterium TaxID=2030807 RepID=A0A662DKB2_UNCAE|nr:MAG: hypothetical protein DRJ04_02115 [Candidatus Aerophobetes bacterium]